MRIFRILYQDNSGLKCEDYKGTDIGFEDKWLIIWKPAPENPHNFLTQIVIAIPTDMIYSVEEIE